MDLEVKHVTGFVYKEIASQKGKVYKMFGVQTNLDTHETNYLVNEERFAFDQDGKEAAIEYYNSLV